MPKSNRPPYRLDKLAAFGQEHQQPCGSRKRSKDDDNLSGTTMNDHPNCTAESSVICLHSPSVEASSTGSSPILAGLGISWGSNTAASSSAPDIHLSETAKDYPAPLVPSSLRRAVSPCKSKNQLAHWPTMRFRLGKISTSLFHPRHPSHPLGLVEASSERYLLSHFLIT